MRIDPHRPLADGIPFVDTEGLTDGQINLLAAREVVWLTEFKVDGVGHAGDIIAASEEQAAAIAFGRGLGEEIVGQLVGVIRA